MRRTARTSSTLATGRAVLALAASAALLAGCAGGVAARSGDTTLSDESVNETAQEFAQMTGTPAMLAGVATTLSRSDAISSVMADHGIVVTNAQVDEALAGEGVTPPEGGLSEGSYDLWRQIYEFEALQAMPEDRQQEVLTDLQATLGTTEGDVNPRYAMGPDSRPLLPTWIATSPRTPGGAAPAPQPLG